jgi:hypothetical protein
LITQFSQIFTNNVIHKLYLSPYTSVLYTKSGAYLKQSVKSQKFFIPGEPLHLKKLFNHLKAGVDDSQLNNLVKKIVDIEDAALWITECMQKGIIE